MEFGTFSFTIFGGYKKFLDPPHTLTIFWGRGIKKFLDPPMHTSNISWNLPLSVFRPPPHTLTIFQGGIKKFLDPPKLFYLQTKHKKWIFSATIHLTRNYVQKLKFGQNCCTPPLHPNGGGHCFF